MEYLEITNASKVRLNLPNGERVPLGLKHSAMRVGFGGLRKRRRDPFLQVLMEGSSKANRPTGKCIPDVVV